MSYLQEDAFSQGGAGRTNRWRWRLELRAGWAGLGWLQLRLARCRRPPLESRCSRSAAPRGRLLAGPAGFFAEKAAGGYALGSLGAGLRAGDRILLGSLFSPGGCSRAFN